MKLHKILNQPRDYPKILYKYRYWDNNHHKRMLTHNEIFLPSPKSFNDPFDNRIPINHLLLDNEEKKEEFVRNKTIKHFDSIENDGRNIEYEMDKLKNKLKNLQNYQEEYEKFIFPTEDKHLGIFSLSKKWDSILMWSYYAKSHIGFCVGFYEEKLRNACLDGKQLFGKGSEISYEKEFPNIDPLFEPKTEEDFITNEFKKSSTKFNGWEHEDEIRFIKLFYPEPANYIEERIFTLNNYFIS